MPDSPSEFSGHRDRLRARFDQSAASLSQQELVELLLTYVIMRRDVGPIAESLLERFGTLDKLLRARPQELEQTAGIGRQASRFLHVVANVLHSIAPELELVSGLDQEASQLGFQQLDEPPLGRDENAGDTARERYLHSFVNDETINSMRFIPQAPDFRDFEAFRTYLNDRLPYNSPTTRRKRANHILARFYPEGRIDTPLTYFVSKSMEEDSLREVLFYHVLKAEPLAAILAEDLVTPALAFGVVNREEMRTLITGQLPNLSEASVTKSLSALFNVYDVLKVADRDDGRLRFRLRSGTVDGFVYVLTSEFVQPGMYSFKALDQGPMHKWLLWDRQWIRRQIYNLRDMNLVSKVSEIDAFQQFTLADDGQTILRRYFEDAQHRRRTLRERADHNYS